MNQAWGLRGVIGPDNRLHFSLRYKAISEDRESVEGTYSIDVKCINEHVTASRLWELFQ
jgi:hypothetical protein